MASPPSGGTPAQSTRIGRNVALVLAGELAGKVATLAFTVVVARQLGNMAFGEFSYALAFGLLMGTLVAWGFDAQVTTRGSVDYDDLNVAVAEALVLRTLHVVPVAIIGGAVGILTRPESSAFLPLILIVLATLLDSFGDTGRAAATAREQPGRSALALVIQRIAACLLAIIVLSLGGDLVAVAAAYLMSSAIGQICLIFVLRRMGVRPSLRTVSSRNLRMVWRSTFFIGLDTVFAMALFRIDALMLGAIAGSTELALYSAAYRLMETVLFITWTASRSFLPAMVRAKPGRELLGLGEGALAVAAALLVPYGVLLCLDGDRLLRLLFGTGYGAGAVVALQWLAFAPVAFALSFYTAYLLFVRGRVGYMLAATIAATALNVLLNVWLIPLLGAEGAAIATTLSYAAEGLLSVALLIRENGVLRVDRALYLSVGASAPMGAFLYFVDLPIVSETLIAGLIYALGYLALVRWRDPGQLRVIQSLIGPATALRPPRG